MGRFDQRFTQDSVARSNQAAGGLLLAARYVAGRHATKVCQLFAVGETIEVANFRTKRPGSYGASAQCNLLWISLELQPLLAQGLRHGLWHNIC